MPCHILKELLQLRRMAYNLWKSIHTKRAYHPFNLDPISFHDVPQRQKRSQILNYEKIKKGCRWYRKFITEEHITVGLITETGKNFLTHITSVPSTAKGIILTVLLIITKRTILI